MKSHKGTQEDGAALGHLLERSRITTNMSVHPLTLELTKRFEPGSFLLEEKRAQQQSFSEQGPEAGVLPLLKDTGQP